MRKKISVVVLSLLFLAVTAQKSYAVNLYNAEGTVVDLYSRLYMMYEYNEQGTFSGNNSRFGLQTKSSVNNDLSVFARAEFRYDASQREKETVFNDLRNTYIGIDSSFGKVTVGNFDSIYYQAVSSKFDIYDNSVAYVVMADGSASSRADSIAYSTPDLMGVKLHGQIRHYGESTTVSGDEKLMFQGGATFSMDALSVGAAALIADDEAEAVFSEETDADGNTATVATAKYSENIYGFSSSYIIFDTLTLRGMVEYKKDAGKSDLHAVMGLGYDYGMGDAYATLGQDWQEEIYYVLGANLKFSKPMRAFAEFASGEVFNPDNAVVTVGLRYDF
ncbi:MAG: porin [Spirochaetes bacterium]|jgi:outer membrane pore protein E|nr:porin [Spirochaetota bacterium]